MKNFMEVIADDSPKTLEKLSKSFEKGGAASYMNAVISEAASPSCVNFPQIKLFVTSNYVCNYNQYKGIKKGEIYVIPINTIAKIYRTNMMPNGKGGSEYSFDSTSIMIEYADGSGRTTGWIPNKTKNMMSQIEEAVALVRGRINVNGGASC